MCAGPLLRIICSAAGGSRNYLHSIATPPRCGPTVMAVLRISGAEVDAGQFTGGGHIRGTRGGVTPAFGLDENLRVTGCALSSRGCGSISRGVGISGFWAVARIDSGPLIARLVARAHLGQTVWAHGRDLRGSLACIVLYTAADGAARASGETIECVVSGRGEPSGGGRADAANPLGWRGLVETRDSGP